MNENKKRILVVDDEPSITRLLKINLEDTNHYLVQVESSALRVLETAQRFHPDLILLDVMMPDGDGGDVASQLQETPGLKGVRIVFLTAAVTKEEVNSHRGRIGGLPFLAKPVDMSEVLGCLEQQLGN
jgi:DNA-binding response OmpR family regulator